MGVKFHVGRQRATSVLSPSNAGYVRSINAQMKVLQKNVENAVKGIEHALPAALRYGVVPIFNLSQSLVPKDKGTLARSGYIEMRNRGHGAQAIVGYAKHGNPAYAIYVHERIDSRHAGGTQAKFLEDAVKLKQHLIGPRTARKLQQLTGIK